MPDPPVALPLGLLLSEKSSFSHMQSRPEAANLTQEGLVTALGTVRKRSHSVGLLGPLPPTPEVIFWAVSSDWAEWETLIYNQGFRPGIPRYSSVGLS